MIYIKEVPTVENIDNMWDLLVLHREELATNKKLMILKPDRQKYKKLEDLGCLKTLMLFDNEKMIGYSILILTNALHYMDLTMGQSDVLFIHPDYRKGRWGIKLIQETEKLAKNHGIKFITWHGKENTSFSHLMPKLGYQVQDIIFSKEL